MVSFFYFSKKEIMTSKELSLGIVRAVGIIAAISLLLFFLYKIMFGLFHLKAEMKKDKVGVTHLLL
mgnify:CR=1 FL=1